MTSEVNLPILGNLVQGRFRYGISLLVEFEPKSIWYEASLTMAAHALRDGIRTEYHTFQHMPNEVIEALAKLGLNVKRLQEEGGLIINDSYTVQLGMGHGEYTDRAATAKVITQSVKLSDWSIGVSQDMKTGYPEAEKRRLHIDDNTGVLLQYNDEKQIIDTWRTRLIPLSRVGEFVFLFSLVTGVASDAFYRQFEALADGVIQFKAEEKEEGIEQLVSVRTMRGRAHDSRWHRLRLLDDGEVTLVE